MAEIDVFISYSTKNAEAAKAVCLALEENGIRCWIAPRDIPPGMNYGDLIDTAIISSKVFLLVYSSDSLESQWCNGELNVAFTEGKTIVPYRIEPAPLKGAMRVILSQTHWIDSYPDYKSRFSDLVQTIACMVNKNMMDKEIVQTYKACTNPECVDFDKHILLPEFLFCPRCGFETRCASMNTNRIIDIFFPVNGLILGNQCDFIRERFLNCVNELSEDDGDDYVLCNFKQGGHCYYNISRGGFTEFWIEKKDRMFSEWAAKGFDMGLSYDSWCELLLSFGFKFEHIKMDYNLHTQTLIAIASDNSFRFELTFRFVDVYTNRKYSKDSCDTLMNIIAIVE